MNEIKQNEVRWSSIIIPLFRFILRWKGNEDRFKVDAKKKKVYFMEWNAFHVILNHQLNTVLFYFIPFRQSKRS